MFYLQMKKKLWFFNPVYFGIIDEINQSKYQQDLAEKIPILRIVWNGHSNSTSNIKKQESAHKSQKQSPRGVP